MLHPNPMIAPVISTALLEGAFTGILFVVALLIAITLLGILAYLARGRREGGPPKP
jgi:hypothetical protein